MVSARIFPGRLIRKPHQYEVTTGNAKFLTQAARIVFGNESELLQAGKVRF